MTAFMRQVEAAFDLGLSGYEDLYRFSIDRPADFWREVWSFCGIRGEMGERVVVDLDKVPGARFFPDARLNFAENVLRRRDSAPAIIFNGEGRGRSLSHAELYAEVARFAAAPADRRDGDATFGSAQRRPNRPPGRDREIRMKHAMCPTMPRESRHAEKSVY